MRSYHLIDIPQLSDIQQQSLLYLKEMDLLEHHPHVWTELDLHRTLDAVPALLSALRSLRLIPRTISAVITQQPIHLHVDAPPHVAKLNFPIHNTQHWLNRWVHLPADVIEAAPEKTRHGRGETGISAKEFRGMDISGYAVEELVALSSAYVLNSTRPHGVYPIDELFSPQRVLLSCTLHNEPLDLLKF